jgi:hypothetical protein
VQQALGVKIDPNLVQVAPAVGGVAFQKMRLLWDGTRKHLQGQLKSLEAAILEEAEDEPDIADIATNIGKLHASLATLDERLSDALDDLYNQGGTDPALRRTAKDIALSYEGFAATDPLLQELDDNPFIPLDATKRLEETLKSIIGHL